MLRVILPVFLVLVVTSTNAQSISGIVNKYTAVTAIDTCAGTLQVTDTSGFKKGDAILIIQMQGAAIASGNNSNYGNIQNLNSAGRYERAVLDSVGNGAFFLQNTLLNIYQPSGKIQAVRIASYTSVTVSDTVFARNWDGQTGGILALEVSDTLTLDAPLWADGTGFRGGTASIAPGNNCNFLIPETGYFYPVGNWRGSYKGEGVALSEAGKELGRGPQASGGGGGNDHNAGGGGGAHVGRGGIGGENDEPSAFGCDGYYPGFGGQALPNNPFRLFVGGGGGAGHANNTLNGSGAPGGGIIMVHAGVITGTQPVLSARGLPAKTADGDGGGGGGAGGSIRLEVQSAAQNLQINADGGKGGNTSNNNGDRCFGPGGGGSGGRIFTNLTGIDMPLGGQAGVVTNSTNGCNGTSNGATPGENGRVDTLQVTPQSAWALHPEILVQPLSDTVCLGAPAAFIVQTNPGNWQFQWQETYAGSSWINAGPGHAFSHAQTDTLVADSVYFSFDGLLLRVLVSRPGCFQITSDTVQISVLFPPFAGFNYTATGENVTFQNFSAFADGYHWDFGDQQTSTEVNPQHTYSEEGNYTVTLTVFNGCDTVTASQQISILLLPEAGFVAPDSVAACGPASVLFENQSSENSGSFLWQFPGGTPESSTDANPVVVYGNSGEYTVSLIVSNNAGSDTSVQTVQVQILDFPAAQFTYTLLPDGLVELVNTSTGDAGFVWDFGDNSPLVEADSVVSHTYSTNGEYTITLVASNACGASVFQQTIQVESGSVGTTEASDIYRIRFYPNPADDFLVIDCSLLQVPPDAVLLLDAAGRTVFSKNGFTEWKPVVSLKNLPAGVYWVQVRTGNEWTREMVIRG